MFFRILIILSCVAALVLVAVFRVPIATYLWDTTKSFPEALLMLSQDAALGIRMGDHYFDGVDGEVEYDVDRAERLYRRALEIDPMAGDGYYELARIAFLRAEYTEALARLDQHIELHGDAKPSAFYLKGLVQAFSGDPEKALETFEYYHTYDRTSWYIHNNLAWVHFQLGDYAAVERVSREGLVHNPRNPWLLMDRAVAQFNMGNRDRAIALLAHAKQAAEDETEASWLRHYPGNDPLIAELGLQEFWDTLEYNEQLFHTE